MEYAIDQRTSTITCLGEKAHDVASSYLIIYTSLRICIAAVFSVSV